MNTKPKRWVTLICKKCHKPFDVKYHKRFQQACSLSCLPFEVRFWNKVKKTKSCWLWTGAKDPKSYGKFGWHNRRSKRCHRLAWELAHGRIPKGLQVLHRCDNPPCVNAAHLFLGTPKDNTHDAIAKNRLAHGEHHGNARLTNHDVLQIRARYNGIFGQQTAIARIYGISPTTVRDIVHGINWRHLIPDVHNPTPPIVRCSPPDQVAG